MAAVVVAVSPPPPWLLLRRVIFGMVELGIQGKHQLRCTGSGTREFSRKKRPRSNRDRGRYDLNLYPVTS